METNKSLRQRNAKGRILKYMPNEDCHIIFVSKVVCKQNVLNFKVIYIVFVEYFYR